MRKFLLCVLFLFLLSASSYAENLPIAKEDSNDILISRLQAENKELSIIVKILLAKTGCVIQQNGINCPDVKLEDVNGKK